MDGPWRGAWLAHRSPAFAFGLTRFACQTAVQEKAEKDRQSPRPAWRSLPGHKWGSLRWPSGVRTMEDEKPHLTEEDIKRRKSDSLSRRWR